MHKTSVAALLIQIAGLGLLVGCNGLLEPDDAPGPVTSTPGTPPPAPAAAPDVPRAAPASVDETPKLDPKAREAACAAEDASREARGSFTDYPEDVDVTATIEDVDAKQARLVIRVDYPPTKKETPEHGLERHESWSYTNFTIASASGKDAFAVGTYEKTEINGSGGGNVCYLDGGHGGSATWGQDPAQLVITKRTADLVEGTFGDKSFSAVILPPVTSSTPRAFCCL